MLTGDKELKATLQRLKKNAKDALRRGARLAAKIIQSSAKQAAPSLTGRLKQSLKVRALPRSRKYVGMQVTFIGLPYLGAVEFGTKKMLAEHFFKKSEEQVKVQALDVFVGEVKELLIDR